MKFLCLAYGDEKAWNALSKKEQDRLLSQDDMLRKRGDVVAAVDQAAKTVTAWEGTPMVTDSAFSISRLPLAGFYIVEASDINEAIQLIANTPCARAKGAIEVRAIEQHKDAGRART